MRDVYDPEALTESFKTSLWSTLVADRVCGANRLLARDAAGAREPRHPAQFAEHLKPLQPGVDPALRPSSACVPASAMRPASSTTIWSASRMVESRCAITTVVRPRISDRIASWTRTLRFGVERARRLVEEQDGRILQEGAGERDALALAARQAHAARPDFACRSPPAVRR